MSKTINERLVLVAGTYTLSDAYPNVRYRIEALKQQTAFQLIELQTDSSTRLDYYSERSRLLSLSLIAVNQLKNSFFCVTAIIRSRQAEALYIPYPAVPLLLLLSCVPRKWLPKRIVADTFISLYDTIVMDRKLLKSGSLLARCLRQLERRALLTADVALTDTPENSDYLAELLDLRKPLLQDLPLYINETCFRQLEVEPQNRASNNCAFRILFVGTLVPLHRIDYILAAITLLEPQRIIEFTFIGDGQQSGLLESFLEQANYDTGKISIRWIRQWQSSEEIQRYIQDAHLCLGIMGQEGKSSRVWPFKNYLYMASGKTLITAETPVTARLRRMVDYPAFLTIDACEPEDLANSLTACADDPGFPGELPVNAARFFDEKLSLSANQSRLFKLVTGKRLH